MKTFNIFQFRSICALAVVSLMTLLSAGCGDGGGGGAPAATSTKVNAVLRSSQEVTLNSSTATGTAEVTVDAAKTTIKVDLNTTGLTNVTASHIHFGKAGANGGVLFSLFKSPDDGSFPATLTKTLTSTNFTPDAANGINTFAAAVNAILAGNTYVNVHTQANQGGEIRGQIGPVSLAAVTMTGAQESTPVVTTASGNATAKFDDTQSTITVTLNTTGLNGVILSHIHFGKAGVNALPIFTLFAAPGTFTSPFTKTLTSTDFTPDAANGINTFSDAVNAILSGNTYINVHTQANTGGEIRGQIGPAAFKATLNGASEVPANGSTTTGTAKLRFNADQTVITLVNLQTDAFTSNVVSSHIHIGPVGQNGDILFGLFEAGLTPTTQLSLTNKTLTSTDLGPTYAAAGNTFASAVNAILSRNAYINVHTNLFNPGEIRGQLTSE